MQLYHRQISLDRSTSRNTGVTWGEITASTFYVKVMMTQRFNNLGLFTDIDYVREQPDYSILINKLNLSGLTFPFMSGQVPPSVTLDESNYTIRVDNQDVTDWYVEGGIITGSTEERIDELKSYDIDNPFVAGFDLEAETYLNYQGNPINGVSRVISVNPNDTYYTFDAADDANLGTPSQSTGILYHSIGQNKSADKQIRDYVQIPLSNLQYKSEGWNETNSSLSALTKEEYLLGIISPPEVFSDVFIDRGATTVMEKHLKLSEVESLEHLENFGNGFYNIVRI